MKKLLLYLSACLLLVNAATAQEAVRSLSELAALPLVILEVNAENTFIDSLPPVGSTRPTRKPDSQRGSIAAEVRGFFVPFYEEYGDRYGAVGSLAGGYFIANSLLVGANVTFLTSRHHEYIYFDLVKYNQRDWLYGPLIRYHFGKSRVSGFMEVSYQWGHSSHIFKDKYQSYSRLYPGPSNTSYLIVTPGLSIRLFGSIKATATVGLMKDFFFPGITVDGLMPQIGYAIPSNRFLSNT